MLTGSSLAPGQSQHRDSSSFASEFSVRLFTGLQRRRRISTLSCPAICCSNGDRHTFEKSAVEGVLQCCIKLIEKLGDDLERVRTACPRYLLPYAWKVMQDYG